jgi:hypothetical protein
VAWAWLANSTEGEGHDLPSKVLTVKDTLIRSSIVAAVATVSVACAQVTGINELNARYQATLDASDGGLPDSSASDAGALESGTSGSRDASACSYRTSEDCKGVRIRIGLGADVSELISVTLERVGRPGCTNERIVLCDNPATPSRLCLAGDNKQEVDLCVDEELNVEAKAEPQGFASDWCVINQGDQVANCEDAVTAGVSSERRGKVKVVRPRNLSLVTPTQLTIETN